MTCLLSKSATSQLIRNTTCQRCMQMSTSTKNSIRVAVVGGGAAGMSAALHLAPLVERGLIQGPVDIYNDKQKQERQIGVGIWSTALRPFQKIAMLKQVYENMTNAGCWIGDVGYRTPSGIWLAKSHLPVNDEIESSDLPALLFLREMDMLESLKSVIQENDKLIRIHDNVRIERIDEQSPLPWSAGLQVGSDVTPRDYHLIVAADGTSSKLRRRYGGHLNLGSSDNIFLSGSSPSPNDLPTEGQASWAHLSQAEATSTQDRNYTVFRGNANLTSEQAGMHGESFQTWGEGKSMRFAAVPMVANNQQEKMVWFITTDYEPVTRERDPVKRRDMLLSEFSTWHDPICQIVKATPPEEILMERAIAHKHSMGPVLNVNQVLRQINNNDNHHYPGPGPAIVFVGDAYMTVDPILAQGFSVAMEGAAALVPAVEQSCINNIFDPRILRNQLQLRHDERTGRLICLLRATELVQALGQPSCDTFTGFVSKNIVRNLMRMAPNVLKTPIFNAMAKYSLGMK